MKEKQLDYNVNISEIENVKVLTKDLKIIDDSLVMVSH